MVMSILCARCVLKSYDQKKKTKTFDFHFFKLVSDKPQHLVDDLSCDRPALYIIPQSDMDTIITRHDVITAVDVKNREIEIYRTFINHDKIPLLTGNYSTAGRAETSMKSFVFRVTENREANHRINRFNAFILALDDNLLYRFFKKYSPEFADQLKQKIYNSAEIKRIDNHTSQYPMKNRPSESTHDIGKVLFGNSIQMVRIREQIIRAGQHTQNVLILGETGTGKSLAARAIHSNSICRDYPFTTFACGSVTGTLFESELFGHVKGAFTGAQSDRNGLWREAENGTLFFDEIGELPLDQQAKILVALDRNVVKPAGSDKEVAVNARLIFATNQDLDAMVQEGRFRDDLYWRIRYITIEMPPLRDQRDSIPFIASKLWETICCDKKDAPLSGEIMDMLKEINWPGNIRNLKAVLKSLYWENVNKRPKDLQDLLAVLGAMQLSSSHIGGSCEPGLEANEIDLHRVKCLRHLKKNEEWLRSCLKMFEPFFLKNTGQKNMEHLDRRLLLNRSEQIKSMTNEPFLFYKEETFILINTLQGKLAYFSELIENKLWTEAALYLNQELKDDFNKAQSLLFKSVQALLR